MVEDDTPESEQALIPCGIVTERQIVHYIAANGLQCLDTVSAAKLSTPTLVTIHVDDSLFEAMVLCRTQKVKQLPVIHEDGTLAGVITHSDMVDANYSQIQKQAELLGDNADPDSINAQLMEMTLTDPMLKIGNRRSMEIDLKHTHEISLRYQRPYSIALIDIDYFKKYNDNYGHQAGDETLIRAAELIGESIRSGDRLYRYGGEEFLLLMPETSTSGAFAVGNRVVNDLAAIGLNHEYSPLGRVTTSVGVAGFDFEEAGDIDTDTVIKNADEALYQAKSNGRNRAEQYVEDTQLKHAG